MMMMMMKSKSKSRKISLLGVAEECCEGEPMQRHTKTHRHKNTKTNTDTKPTTRAQKDVIMHMQAILEGSLEKEKSSRRRAKKQ
mmetsp:Transcript_26359/g.57234  ORF Transcript_26359/g.57234 Transcript_26359/m.57234 type:complete len:84 (-) Transcript_26359:422-673(-)